jgi:rRNA-processing protein FCF1
MKYVFDNNTLTAIFRHYFFERFPTFWDKFNKLVEEKVIISVREVRREIESLNRADRLEAWVNKNRDFFEDPTVEELEFITSIYSVKHFQQNLEQRKLLHGGAFADPFIIAKAKINNCTVVTQEQYKENGTKIPNICKHFDIICTDLEGFLTFENWEF